jgi:hypothetical protein
MHYVSLAAYKYILAVHYRELAVYRPSQYAMLAQAAETALVAAGIAEQARVKAEAARIVAETKAAERAEMRRNSTYSTSNTHDEHLDNTYDNDMPGIYMYIYIYIDDTYNTYSSSILTG